MPPQASIPSPSINSFHIGPLDIHFYALTYLVGIVARDHADPAPLARGGRRLRSWSARSRCGWSRPGSSAAGSTSTSPRRWTSRTCGTARSRYGPAASASGAGCWSAGWWAIWRLHRHGVSPALFADAMAPGLLMAQGIGRIGNYFNKELFGRPTSLPWGLEIPYQYRVSGGIPAADLHFATFQPTFLYELIFDFAWAGALIWLGRHRQIKPPGLFALYVFGYSAYRIFEESLRIDSSVYIFGLRLNMYIASAADRGRRGLVLPQPAPPSPAADRGAGPPAEPDASSPASQPGTAQGDPDGTEDPAQAAPGASSP